jgi:hypothetical protein
MHCGAKQSTSTLGDRIRLNIAVIVFASPHIPALGLEAPSDHIVDETMFVPNVLGFERICKFAGRVNRAGEENKGPTRLRFKNALENVLESPVVCLEDGVLGTQIARPSFGQCKRQAAPCKLHNRLKT